MNVMQDIMQGFYLVSAMAVAATCIPPIHSIIQKQRNNEIMTSKELRQYSGDDGFIISQNVRLSSRFSKEHVMVFGPTGIGKTNHIVKHNIQHLKNCSIVCTDPSSDIYRDVHREDCKHFVFNPLKPETSIGYDPIQMCNTEYEVRNVMETLILNGFQTGVSGNSDVEKWVKLSSPLLKMYAVYNYRYKKYNFTDMVTRVLTAPLKMECYVNEMVEVDEPSLKQTIGANGRMSMATTSKKTKRMEKVKKIDTRSIEYEILKTKDESLVSELYALLRTIDSPETYSNIQLTLNSALALFKDSSIRKICSKPSFDFRRLRKEKSIVYIQIPEKLSRYFAPLTSILIQQLIDVSRDNPDGNDIYFVLDELCNIGLIPDLDKTLSTIRRYNMGILGCTQSINQLELIYGQAKTKVILENFNTCCAMSGLSETGEYFSKQLGMCLKISHNDTEFYQNVMTSDEIRRLEQDKILIVCKNKRGVVDTLLPFFKVVQL